MPSIYRLIPVTVEALKVAPETVLEAELWCGGREVRQIDPTDSSVHVTAINVPTLSGVLRAQEGDYIVKDNNGVFGVVRGNEFEKNYELIPG